MKKTIFDRTQALKILLDLMDTPFIESKRYITFYECKELVSIEHDYLVDNRVNFNTQATDMTEFNIETNFFLEDWTDAMTDDRFEKFLKLYKSFNNMFDLFFLKLVA